MLIAKAVTLLGLVVLSGIVSCASVATPLQPVAQVDLSRYLGRWYVIAMIPTRVERAAYNAVETYSRNPDGTICTWYRFRTGSENSPVKLIRSTAAVVPGTGNAAWSVHMYWLLRLQYLVGWLKPDYSQVLVVRDKRDHLWYMAREPQVSEVDLDAMRMRARSMGYDVSRIVYVPQRWPERGAGSNTFPEQYP